MSDLERCIREQAECAECIASNLVDEQIALWASDWMAEEIIILADLEDSE